MKYIFSLVFALLSLTSFSQRVSGLGRVNVDQSFTTYPLRTGVATITFDIAAQRMDIPHPGANFTFTTVYANNSSFTAVAVVTIHGDSVHRIIIDTTSTTGFKRIGVPDSLHDNVLTFRWFGAGYRPTCEVSTNYTNTLAVPQIVSDSMRNNVNDVITILNADKALSFTGNAAFSMGTQIKIFSGTQHTIFCRKESGPIYPIVFDVSSAGYVQIKIADSLGNSIFAQGTDLAIFNGGWHNIAVAYSGNKDTSGLSIWVDGVKSVPLKTKSGTLVNTFVGTGGCQFMEGASAGAYNFDQFFAMTGVITGPQLLEFYNSNNHVSVGDLSFAASLVAWYPWYGSQWTDFTGNGHTLSATSHQFSNDAK